MTFAWQLTVAAGRHDERLTGRMSGADEREARSVALEKAYVHEVYEQISGTQLPAGASADSQRGRAWPKVKQFLSELEPGSLVCDVGKWHLPFQCSVFYSNSRWNSRYVMPLMLDEQLLRDVQGVSIYFKLCIKHLICNAQGVYFSVFK